LLFVETGRSKVPRGVGQEGLKERRRRRERSRRKRKRKRGEGEED
jgi:hypothetical protein